MLDKLRVSCYLLIASYKQRMFYNALRRLFRLKPVLSYLEVHLADHCNLNCSGCSHFSPLADKFFANIEEYDGDMKRLSQLIADIKVLRLLGGEPLLHPNVTKFLDSTRTWFPKANIHLVTNGILLPSMHREFWESCRRNSISIDVTLYPPLFSHESDLVQLSKSKGIPMNIVKTSTFRSSTNSKGDSELEKTFKRCRTWLYCPILKQGKIYPCAKPAYVHYFNNTFGTDIPDTDFAHIYSPKATGWTLLSRINTHPEACRYCTYGWEKIPTHVWTKSCRNQKEWDVAN
jgi:hypothetical protein